MHRREAKPPEAVPASEAMKKTAHRHAVRVYFEDTDAGGVAYHATYLRWAERARTESLRSMHLPHALLMERYNAMLVVRRIEVAYVRPARLDESLIVETRVRAMGAATLDLDQLVLREADGAELARLAVGLVCVRATSAGSAGAADELRPARIPEPWRSALAELMSGGAAA
ncbi:MAG TPA: YbgC/FadM family acyl-CoA thioesterase [Falsiroseomonas sp.]|jgi:acyl-CoA thioester hydrolase|nr:YbgC/FadM family acyl-CoA thioesterase [Falsiroseomonas sp.]